MADMHRLQPDQLKLDHPLPWNVYDSGGNLLLRKGFMLERNAQILALIERGMFVKASELNVYEKSQLSAAFDPLSLWDSIQAHLAYLLEALPHDGTLQYEVEHLARQVMQLAERAPDLAIAAITLLEQRNYPIAHSLHSAVIADMVARRAGWKSPERVSLAAAALTMNVSMIELQMRLYNQREPLLSEQRRAIQEHPAESARQLIRAGVEDDEWLRAVLEHHETPDAKGYPRRVPNPSEMALILQIADIFAAKVSPRAHRRPMMASQATKEIFTKYSYEGKNPFPKLLVNEIGIYPPGAIVRLANGEVGVIQRRGSNPKNPLVASLLNATGMPMLKPVIRTIGNEPQYAIVGVLPQDTALIGLHFEQIWNGKEAAR